MEKSTTSIAELPQSSGIQNLRPSVQIPQVSQVSHVQEPNQNLPVSTQQISNEFYGQVSGQAQYTQQQQSRYYCCTSNDGATWESSTTACRQSIALVSVPT